MASKRLTRLRASFRRGRRVVSARDGYRWFRFGYFMALEDIERTGLIPKTKQAQEEFMDRALEKWVDDAS